MIKKIVITGGDGRFAQVLKRDNKKLNILYPNKKDLNILNMYLCWVKRPYEFSCVKRRN